MEAKMGFFGSIAEETLVICQRYELITRLTEPRFFM